ncbi:MAG TPA: AMP-binding protein [Candidatus Saccharimonadales bacterium]|nr:AMP-binding protein [Candidatus Saccharimonadales bacterium]
MTDNLVQLFLAAATLRPDARFGMASEPWTLVRSVETSGRAAAAFRQPGLQAGDRVALIGHTSMSYLLAWMALHMLGVEVALINPVYPAELLTKMLAELEPQAVVWSGRSPDHATAPTVTHLDASDLAAGRLRVGGDVVQIAALSGVAQGARRRPLDIAGYMHTSGTTGTPKFCAQTHSYFLRLGRFVADSLCLSPADTVVAPLPMFHINPLGYGVIGALTAQADVLTVPRFSASQFWPTVLATHATVLVLHAPPVEILKRATTAEDAAGHRVRAVFYADDEFLNRFAVPLGLSCYGSTEAAGLTHTWAWRRGEATSIPEGMARYGGRARPDVAWSVDAEGEILVRGDRPGVLFSGYRRGATLENPLDADGWFHTGDLGRVDERGNLIFIERRSDSIRVRGEYVPIAFVEQRFADIESVHEAAVWRRESGLVDDEIVLFIVGDRLPLEDIRRVAGALPSFMRPTSVARIAAMPRDGGVGKLRRRLLASVVPLEASAL